MDFDQQLIVRIKSFLGSADLTDSPTARELYDAYREINDLAARRVVECEVMIQKKQKIEAMMWARRSPDLKTMLDLLFCPERKQLAELADLYDWRRWEDIDEEAVRQLRTSIDGMDELRPLLTEFRRLARTDQVEKKLHLLRDIYRMDKGNPEWRDALCDVEKQYLFRLISEAQQVIETGDAERLLAIHDELHGSEWQVPVPDMVMQKIDRLAGEIRGRRTKEQAVKLLDRIGTAYGAFDVVALEDAMLCWDKLCRDTGYRPDEKEQTQIREADGYLKKEQRKIREQQKFQNLIEKTGELIDANAPLDEVEKCYAAALALNQEAPKHVAKRVEQYRLDIERARRTAAVLKAVKIVGIAAIVIVILAGGTLLTTQYFIEKKLTANLRAAIENGDVDQAQALLANIEKKHPNLAKRPKIAEARADLEALKKREAERVGSLNTTLAELDALLKNGEIDAINSKLDAARKLAKSETERVQVEDRAARAKELFAEQKAQIEARFQMQIGKLRTLNEEADRAIDNAGQSGDLTLARRKLDEIDELTARIRSTPGIDSALLDENQSILETGAELRKKLDKIEEFQSELGRCLDRISGAENINDLESGIKALDALLETSRGVAVADDIRARRDVLKKDLADLKDILNYQAGRLSADEISKKRSGFFDDAKKLDGYRRKRAAVREKLIENFETLRQSMSSDSLFFIRLTDGEDRVIDLYVKNGFVGSDSEIELKRSDDVPVKISGDLGSGRGYFRVTIGGIEHSRCRLNRPRRLTPEGIRASVAPHQRIIENFHKELLGADDADILKIGVRFLKELYADPECSPYWKLQLSLQVLPELAQLEWTLNDVGELKKLADAFQRLDNSGGDSSESPLYNEIFRDRIIAFIEKNCDPKKLDAAVANTELLGRRYRIIVEQKFVFLGVHMKNKNGKLTSNAAMRGRSGDVWCFDKEGYGCYTVGSFDADGLLLDGNFAERAEGRLLFTTVKPVNMKRETEKWLEDPAAAELKNTEWPGFWPLNLRGE